MKSKFADFIRLIYGRNYSDHEIINEKNEIKISGVQSDLAFFDHRKKE